MSVLIAIALKSLLVAGLMLGLLALLKHRSAAERSWVAHIGLLALIIMAFAPLALPSWNVETPAFLNPSPATEAPAATPAPDAKVVPQGVVLPSAAAAADAASLPKISAVAAASALYAVPALTAEKAADIPKDAYYNDPLTATERSGIASEENVSAACRPTSTE